MKKNKKCFKKDCQKIPTFSVYNKKTKKTTYACEEHKREVTAYPEYLSYLKKSGHISQ